MTSRCRSECCEFGTPSNPMSGRDVHGAKCLETPNEFLTWAVCLCHSGHKQLGPEPCSHASASWRVHDKLQSVRVTTYAPFGWPTERQLPPAFPFEAVCNKSHQNSKFSGFATRLGLGWIRPAPPPPASPGPATLPSLAWTAPQAPLRTHGPQAFTALSTRPRRCWGMWWARAVEEAGAAG